MIAHLNGLLLRKTTQSLVIDVGGVGYEVFVPLSTFYSLPEEGKGVSLHIYTHSREDVLLLFGFDTKLEKDLFLMLTSISGIGPKLSVNILSGIGPADLLGAIADGDADRLQAIPGVGKKTAERIALELKDRASMVLCHEGSSLPPALESKSERFTDDALSALLNLGYSPKLAERAIRDARALIKKPTLEELIRESLKVLA